MNSLSIQFLFLFLILQFCKIRCTHITILPYEKDCFFFQADKNNVIVGSYEIIDGNNSCKIIIHQGNSLARVKNENILFSSISPRENFQLKVSRQGVHSFCYHNDGSSELNMIFTLRVKESVHDISESELSTVDDVQKINEATQALYQKFLEAFDEQERMLEIADVYSRVNEKIHSRLILWSEIQIICTIVLTGVHLYSIKSFFEIKTIV